MLSVRLFLEAYDCGVFGFVAGTDRTIFGIYFYFSRPGTYPLQRDRILRVSFRLNDCVGAQIENSILQDLIPEAKTYSVGPVNPKYICSDRTIFRGKRVRFSLGVITMPFWIVRPHICNRKKSAI